MLKKITETTLFSKIKNLSGAIRKIAVGSTPQISHEDTSNITPLKPAKKLKTKTSEKLNTPVASLESSIEINTELNMESDHNFYNGFSEDIVDGGIFIATFDPKPVGSNVVVKFKLPQKHQVVAKGIVQFIKIENPLEDADSRTGMGIQFTNLMKSDRQAIEEYQKSRHPLFYES
jgi:uncharacterized protein (TIGR02266 family)